MVCQNKVTDAEPLVLAELETLQPNVRNAVLLGAIYAIQGRWEEAVGPMSRAVEIETSEDYCRYYKAVTLLRAGHIAEYRRHCHEFLQRPACAWSTTAALLLPVDGDDFDRACEAADVEATRDNDPIVQFVKPFAEIRRGRFTVARQLATKILTAEDTSASYKALAYFLRALASAHDGQIESARLDLARGEEQLTLERDETITSFWGSHAWALSDCLRCEAQSLIDHEIPNSNDP
jgi:hypothetical protein